MNKPLSIKRQEFINGMIELVNNSGLPPFVIEPILKDFHNSAVVATDKQYQAEKALYEKQLEDEKEE